ncbi:uncharacterized protein LOC128677560 [Plodia interpunctella]|uniref:uncharacterized protein LOC128677560 n=1 Tax=Plodia interpunctella TaxID=58824 RepID=UPI0023683BDD|nr:uncharacterized protein LOC128677560 [Plodia interpunctella]
MKSFLLFLCLAAADKLDRTYLPPPGSKFSGGIDGDIQTPFETPKETYSTTTRPDIYNNGAITPEDTKIDIGINRIPIRPGSSGNIITPVGQTPSDYYQSTYKAPTTTTSYAFTTTTTHPPHEAYETTTGHINPITGLPTTVYNFPTTVPNFISPHGSYQENQQTPFQQTQQPGRRPAYGQHYPATSTLAPNFQFVEQNRRGFVQGQDQNLSQRPGFAPGLTQVPGTLAGADLSQSTLPQGNNFNSIENHRPDFQPGSIQRPGFSQSEDLSQYQGSKYPANVPNMGQQNNLVPSTFAPSTTPGTIQYGGDLDQGIIANQNIPFSQRPNLSRPVTNIPYYPGQNQSGYNVTPGQQQVLHQSPYGQPQYGSNQVTSAPSQYPVSQLDELGRPIAYKPISTISPSSFIPGTNQNFGTTPGSQASATTVYPTGSYPSIPINSVTGSQVVSSGLISHPERPQADSDRNAVILNYENVITPEGFAYSFDTSNGIHADESGTAVDGVKAKGSYSYIGDDGKLYSVVYTADENGFVPHGDHLPTSPPIPEAIKKVIEQAKKDQEDGISDNGTYDEDKYGHMKYHGKKPQRPNRINIDSKVPESYDNKYTQNNRRKQRPQSGDKIPAFSNQNDYEDFENGQNQDRESPINLDQKQKFTNEKTLSNRPGKTSEENNEEYDTQIKDEKNNEGSRRPINRPKDDRRQFGGQFSVQRPDQYFSNDKNNLSPDQGSVLKENYPDYNQTIQKYYIDADRRKPSINRLMHQLGDKLDNTHDYIDDLGSHDNYNSPTEIPSDYRNDGQKELTQAEISTRRPSQSSKYNNRVTSTPGRYKERYGNRLHPINATTTPYDQSNIYNYQETKRLGDIDQYLPGNTSNQRVSSSTSSPISSQYIGSPIVVMQKEIEDHAGPGYHPAANRPSLNIPFTETDNFDSTIPQLTDTGKANGPNLVYKYDSIKGRPQTPTSSVPKQDNEYYGSRIDEPGVTGVHNINHPIPGRIPTEANRYTTIATKKKEEGYQYLPPQRKFEHASQRPQNYDTTSVRPSKNRTYFTKEEVPKPFTTPDASRDENAQYDDLEYTHDINKDNTPHSGSVQSNLQLTTPSLHSYEENNKYGPVNYNVIGQRRPSILGGRNEDENDKFTTIGSTRRPTYQQTQTTSRPQQQYGQTVSIYDTTKGAPTSTVRPQESEHYYDRNGNEIVYRPSPSRPSQTGQFEVTQPTTLEPVRQNIDGFVGGNDQSPVQRFFPTTTKAPAQIPVGYNGKHVYEQMPSQPPYQTTYRPMLSVTSGVDSDEVTGTTVRPDKIPFRGPGYSQSQIPSTTYRPAYFPSNTATEKQIIVDKFGRPVPHSGLVNQQGSASYRPSSIPNNTVTEKQITVDKFGRPIPPSDIIGSQPAVPSSTSTYRPSFISGNTVTEKKITVDKFGRPSEVINQQEYKPGFSDVIENVGPSSQGSLTPEGELKPSVDMYGRPLRPSVTTTEKVIGENFSGPKQAQRFDPERGYYY